MPVPTTTFELLSQPFERCRIFVYDDDLVAVGIEEFCEGRADPAAADDEIAHERLSGFECAQPISLVVGTRDGSASPRTGPVYGGR